MENTQSAFTKECFSYEAVASAELVSDDMLEEEMLAVAALEKAHQHPSPAREEVFVLEVLKGNLCAQ